MKKFVVVEDFTEYQVNHLCKNDQEVCKKIREIVESGHCEPEYISIVEVSDHRKLTDLFDVEEIKKEPA